MTMERSKRGEKPAVDPHREFLDMDSEEEDFTGQESTEVEEEIPVEPEKPIISEQDLVTLVRYIKELVVLPSLKKSNWNNNCHEAIREYMKNPSHSVLCVFFEENTLRTTLNLPKKLVDNFVYFVRSPWHVYTTENFHETIIFGSINSNVQNCVLKFMENVYAPIVLNSGQWPNIIRHDLFLSLHDFLICLSEEIYKTRGKTMLYVPREALIKTMFHEASISAEFFLSKDEDGIAIIEENKMKKDLINRLEKIMLRWLRQMREALAAVLLRKDVQKIQDELEHWNDIYLNLKYLHAQLLNEEVQLIVQILRNVCLSSAEAFQNLIDRLKTTLTEVTSNLAYLNILSESCKSLNAPEDIETSVTEILLLIIFIWAESPFYSNSSNVETLCRALGTQIIQQCREHIDLDVAFKDDPESAIKIIEKCISCCQTYETTYNKLIKEVTVRVSPHKNWDTKTENVFDRIHMFMQRCFDVIDVCRTLIVFGSCDKVGTFGSPKGTEYEACCRNIQHTFHENLETIIAVREIIFDVAKSDWLVIIHGFRNAVLELENMAKNLIESIFENVKNVDEGIEAIHALQKFDQRESLKKILEEKWIQIWKIFDKEIEKCNDATNEIHEYHAIIKCAQDMDKLCIKQYLKWQHDTMIRASDWIGNCVAEEYILQCYKRVLNVIDCKNSQ